MLRIVNPKKRLTSFEKIVMEIKVKWFGDSIGWGFTGGGVKSPEGIEPN